MKTEAHRGGETVPVAMHGADTVERRVYRILMQLVDEVALHDAPDFDPAAWRRLAQTFEDLIDEHFHGPGQRQDARLNSLSVTAGENSMRAVSAGKRIL